MKFIEFIQCNREILMSFTYLITGIIGGIFSSLKKKQTKIVCFIVLSIISISITICLYYNFWQNLLLGIVIILTILVIPCFPLILQKNIINRKRIEKLLFDATKEADPTKEICLICGDMDFFGSYFHDATDKNKIINNIENNNQFLQLKNLGVTVKILTHKPDSNSTNDKQSRIRIGFLKNEIETKIEFKFFNNKICEENGSCPYELKIPQCNFICNCPDPHLRGRLFYLKTTGAIKAVFVTPIKTGFKYRLEEYGNDSRECILYKLIWDSWWERSQIDTDFISKCIKEFEQEKHNNLN